MLRVTPVNDYYFRVRDPSLCAGRMTEMTVSVIETYIPHTFVTLKPVNLGLTQLVLVLPEIERRLTKVSLSSIS